MGSHWDNWCMNGGEDFELVLTLHPNWAKAFLDAFHSSKKIGVIKAGTPKLIWKNGIEIRDPLPLEFKHFN